LKLLHSKNVVLGIIAIEISLHQSHTKANYLASRILWLVLNLWSANGD